MIEAEFHAVWVDSEGLHHDITPKPLELNSILFLPDPSRVYENKQVDNVRVALVGDALIKNFIKLSKNLFEATNQGVSDNPYYCIVTEEVSQLSQEHSNMLRKISEKFFSRIHFSGEDRNKLCSCGSGRKCKKCCWEKM